MRLDLTWCMGTGLKENVYLGHIREARNFARGTVVWFLEFLIMIQDEIQKSKMILNIQSVISF